MDVLINKQYSAEHKNSRYSNVPYYYHIEDDKYTRAYSKHLNKDSAYTVYKVMENDTLDSIALQYYNNPTYYWIIADFNRIIDPFEKLEVGRLLQIPSMSTISFEE